MIINATNLFVSESNIHWAIHRITYNLGSSHSMGQPLCVFHEPDNDRYYLNNGHHRLAHKLIDGVPFHFMSKKFTCRHPLLDDYRPIMDAVPEEYKQYIQGLTIEFLKHKVNDFEQLMKENNANELLLRNTDSQ